MLSELYAQHPLPWTFDDTHPGFEGRLIVWDANKSIGSIVIDLGDMEDCTMADILLAHAIAALPELIAHCEGLLKHVYPCNAQDPDIEGECPPSHPNECGRCYDVRMARAALGKAGMKEQGNA